MTLFMTFGYSWSLRLEHRALRLSLERRMRRGASRLLLLFRRLRNSSTHSTTSHSIVWMHQDFVSEWFASRYRAISWDCWVLYCETYMTKMQPLELATWRNFVSLNLFSPQKSILLFQYGIQYLLASLHLDICYL